MNLTCQVFTNADYDLDRALADVMDLSHDRFSNKELVTCIKDLVELRFRFVNAYNNPLSDALTA